ncbi:alpha/beta fold hydrolase [Saccharopolyspora sp. NPDC002376]
MTNAPTTGLLRVPDGRLHFEVRGRGPLVVLVGAPMDARSFEGLADRLAVDHAVLTTDPRGINRSPLDDPEQDSTPELRADDLARLITHVDAGLAVVLGSSGGAVSTLALVQAHHELISTAVVHEPPLCELLPDREQLRASTEDIIATHLSGDHVGGWRKFLAMANIDMPPEAVGEIFGGERDAQQIADDHYQHAHMLRGTSHWVPDLETLRAGPTRVVVGIGMESGGQLCERTSKALAAELDVDPVLFPGDHIGFAHDPEAFETRLREVLRN